MLLDETVDSISRSATRWGVPIIVELHHLWEEVQDCLCCHDCKHSAFVASNAWCIFLQQYRIHMDIGNSEEYLSIHLGIHFQINQIIHRILWSPKNALYKFKIRILGCPNWCIGIFFRWYLVNVLSNLKHMVLGSWDTLILSSAWRKYTNFGVTWT